MVLLFIIAYPIGKLLDLILGVEHINRFKRQGIQIHQQKILLMKRTQRTRKLAFYRRKGIS